MAEGFGYFKATAIHNKFLSSLIDPEGKMNALQPETVIYLFEDP
jgi:tryptophanyl-tRNA synthetase